MDALKGQRRSERMALVRSRDTGPELAFRRAIWAAGFRFRVCDARLPGKPDVVFARQRVAVFIDGDFWHGGQWRRRKLSSLDDQFREAENAGYWRTKIRRTIERDFRRTSAMLDAGWTVLRFWESDLGRNLERCVKMTVAALKQDAKQTPNSAVAHRTVGEFFAGIGLVRVALESRGWNVAFANDIDPKKASIYADNFGDDHLALADIHSLDAIALPDCALFTASFPCNDLSVAGGRAGLEGKSSSAFWGLIRILKELGERRPPLVLLENVIGFLNSHEGRDFETALVALNKLGYCCDAMALNASSFAPQSRARLFVIAKQLRLAAPCGIVPPCAVRPQALADFINSHPDINWDIRRLPAPPQSGVRLPEILEDLADDDPAWWNSERTEYFMNQLSDRHRALADEMIAGATPTFATAFRRVRKGRSMAELRTDGIAGCLRTPRGGSGRQILFKAGLGRYQVRLLTARECARLQGVPETFKIDVPLNQALFGFGDAVCVPVIEWIVDNYLTPAASELLRGRALVE